MTTNLALLSGSDHFPTPVTDGAGWYDMGAALPANKAARATAAKRSSGLTITTEE